MKSSKQVNSFWKRIFLKSVLAKDIPLIFVGDAFAQKEKFLFLDVRERKEFEVSHIEGALYGGFKDFDIGRVNDMKKDEPLIVYCSVGLRSDRITRRLIDAGYVNAKNLYGGIFEWMNNDFEIVDMEEKPTKNIHAFNRKFAAWLKKGIKVYRN